MAQLPPSAVFGSARPGQPVHVLLLIENSSPMVDHWQDLQQHILPGILGAVRVANPGIDVQIFWETTGKTQDQRATYKTQRHFNDFPDIDIVGLPRNKLSPLFIRQSIDLFLSGDSPNAPITRHLFIVAMSNPIDDLPGKFDQPHQETQNNDVKWDSVATKLQENNIILHVIANPLERLTRIFEIFRKTMRYQSRQEVIPWQPVDSTHCICHLSGSTKYSEKYSHASDQWPEVHLPSAGPPSPSANSPPDMSDDDLPSPISPIDMINSNPGSLSLVSRMQALHGLASRRRPLERSRRPSITRHSFFREVSPTLSPRRERLMNSKNSHSNGNDGTGSGREKERLRQLSMVALNPTHPPANVSTALDLRGLTQDPTPLSQTDPRYASGPAYPTTAAMVGSATGPSPPGMSTHLPPSPGSDGSSSTMSSSLPSISSITRHTNDLAIESAGDATASQSVYTANRPPQQALYPLEVSTSHSTSYQRASEFISPAAIDVPLPLSPTTSQNTIHTVATPQSAYDGLSLPNFSSFSAPYPTFSAPQSRIPAFFGSGEALSPGAPLQPVVEDDGEPEVVPASAPLDERGQVPFIFDANYEAQNMMRLRHAIDSMQEMRSTPVPRVSSTSDLANAGWKVHGTSSSSSFIPELPETFYSASRGRNDDRQPGSYFASSGTETFQLCSWDLQSH